jgi:hypothetical protein
VTAAGTARPEHLELAVDLDPQRLERALGRVAAGAPRRAGTASRHQLDQPGARRERLAVALADDGAGDPRREPLLAVLAQHADQVRDRVRVEHLGRGDARPSGPSACRAGASTAYAKPRSASSSCSDETPRSMSTPRTASMPRSAQHRGSSSYTA